jgi:hypothetical protein
MMARLIFDTPEAHRVASVSRAGKRAKAGMGNFPPFKGVVHRQAVVIPEVRRERS